MGPRRHFAHNQLGIYVGRLHVKKLGSLIVLAAVGVVVVIRTWSAEKRTCERIAELCGATKDDTVRCATELSELRKRGGDEVAIVYMPAFTMRKAARRAA